MIEKEKRGKEEILKLTRKDRFWVCSECDKEFRGVVPPQCSCGAQDKVFMEKELPIEDTGRKTYTVVSNFIYASKQIDKDTIVSLVEKDRVTKGLLDRKLISEIIVKKEKVA